MKFAIETESLDRSGFFAFFSRESSSDATLFRSGRYWYFCRNPLYFCCGTEQETHAAIERLRQWREEILKWEVPPHTLPFSVGLAGYFGYNAGCRVLGVGGRPDTGMPAFCWRCYTETVCFDEFRNIVTLIAPASEFESLKQEVLAAKSYGSASVFGLSGLEPEHEMAAWEEGFRRTQAYIRQGEVYQLNLTRRFVASFTGDPKAMFLQLVEKNPAPYAAFFPTGNGNVISASPELFLRFRSRSVVTEPIKGTAPRSSSPAADRKNRLRLFKSDKEQAELMMITDLLRNDLRRSCRGGTVRVEALRQLQQNPSVWHTFSRISGELSPEVDELDALIRMLPGGSIAGCPKIRACELIEELEPHTRGVFCGSFGFFDAGGNGEFSILIRTLAQQGDRIAFQAGGGITAASVLAKEKREIEAKAAPFLRLGKN